MQRFKVISLTSILFLNFTLFASFASAGADEDWKIVMRAGCDSIGKPFRQGCKEAGYSYMSDSSQDKYLYRLITTMCNQVVGESYMGARKCFLEATVAAMNLSDDEIYERALEICGESGGFKLLTCFNDEYRNYVVLRPRLIVHPLRPGAGLD